MVLNQFVKASSLYKKTYLIYLGAREYLKNVKKKHGKNVKFVVKIVTHVIKSMFQSFF